MNGWGRRCRRRHRWGKGLGWRRGRGMGRWGRGNVGFGGGLSQVISKPISAVKSLFARESPEVVEKAERIYELLPKRDCGACGYDNCYQCALAIAKGEAPPDACRVAGKRIRKEVEKILSQ